MANVPYLPGEIPTVRRPDLPSSAGEPNPPATWRLRTHFPAAVAAKPPSPPTPPVAPKPPVPPISPKPPRFGVGPV